MIGDFPNTPLSQLTPTMQENLKVIDKKVRIMMLVGKVKASSLLIVAADRATNKTYKQQIVVDHAPCLTCHNKYLWIMKAGDVNKPVKDRKPYRLVAPAERLHWQGFDPESVNVLGNALSIKGAGNAFPIGVMLAGVMPMLYAIADNG
eukprot:4567837-Karenia_brevis.AAC.1